MSFSVIGTVQGGSTDFSTATTASIDSTGADLIVLIGGSGSTSSRAFSDSKGNTWTTLVDSGTGVARGSIIAYCHAPTVGSGHTFTITIGFSAQSIVAMVLSGSASSPADQSTSNTGAFAGTSLQTGSITPSENNEILIAGLTESTDVTGMAIDLGFTLAQTVTEAGAAQGMAAAYLIQTSAAAKNPAFSWTNATNSTAAATIASFKAAASGSVGGPYFYRHLAGGGSF